MVWRRVASLSAKACAAGAVALIAACAPTLAPRGTQNEQPTIVSDEFVTRDGLHLPVRHWDAEDPKAIIVALHGMSDYSNAFAIPAPYLADHGISVVAYDQRSFGKAPDPGIWPGSDALRTDLDDFVDVVRAEHPHIPVIALGESMGGAVVLSSLAADRKPNVDGVILVAPAVWSREDMPLLYRIALWTAAHLLPSMTVTGKGLKIWPSDNIDMLRAISRDPLFQKETRSDAVWGLVNLMDQARKTPKKITTAPPILIVYGAKDQIIPAAPTKAVIAELGNKAEVHEYPNGYHMLLRDLGREAPLKDIVSWVDKLAAKP
ncbi:MAG TPA: lysophospholipase [Rhizomicrobium sp.]|nr:lysophospholipase [Rhizomicrobium sp.]